MDKLNQLKLVLCIIGSDRKDFKLCIRITSSQFAKDQTSPVNFTREEHPPFGGDKATLSFPYANSQSKWLRMTVKKISTYIAFFSLFLVKCQSRDCLKFITFFEGFLDAPPAALRFTPSFLGKGKLLRRNIYHVLLIYIWLVILEFLNFECFRTSRNYHFMLLLGGVLAIIPPDVAKIVWNINQWCNVLYGIRYATILIVVLQKWSRMDPKTLFWLILTGFSFMPSRALLFTP